MKNHSFLYFGLKCKLSQVCGFWQLLSLAVFGISGFVGVSEIRCQAETVTVTAPTNYADGIMAGNVIHIDATFPNAGSLTSSDATGFVATSCTLSGNGNWIVNNTGNTYYAGNNDTPKIAPTLNGFTGHLVLGGANTRWMAQQAFYTQFGSGTIDLSREAQVWLSGGMTVAANFHLTDPLKSGMAGVGNVRFDGDGSKINGNIVLDGAGKNFEICVRRDGFTATGTVNGSISGSGNFVFTTNANKDATQSTLILTAANSWMGSTSILDGVLRLTGSGTLGAGAITVTTYSGTWAGILDGTLDLAKTSAMELSQTISGDGNVTQSGSGATTFSGDLVGFTGSFSQTNGTTTFSGSASALGSNSSMTLSGGTMNLGTLTSLGTFNYLGGTLNPGSSPLSVSALNLGGMMSFDLMTSAFALPSGGKASVNSGGTVVASSVSQLDSVYAATTLNGGSVWLQADSDYVITTDETFDHPLEIKDPGILNVPVTHATPKTAKLTVSNENETVSFSTSLGEATDATGQSLVKNGAGTLEINNPEFTGSVTVEAGKLVLTGTSTVSKVTVASGATARLDKTALNCNQTYAGAGTLEFFMSEADKIDTSKFSNSGKTFTGKVVYGEGSTGYIRFLPYGNLKNFDACILEFKNGSQLHVGSSGNYACSLILSGTSSSYENRGALRFDVAPNQTSGAVLTGPIQLAGDTMMTVRQKDFVGWGMISGGVSGAGKLILGDATIGTLVLTGENSWSGGTEIVRGTLQIGHTGTVNGTNYDGTKGTIGTGKLTVSANGELNYCRTDTQGLNFTGDVANSGVIRVQSGRFTTSGASVVNSGSWTVANGAKSVAASAFTNEVTLTIEDGGTFLSAETLTNSGTLNVGSATGSATDFAVLFAKGTLDLSGADSTVNINPNSILSVGSEADTIAQTLVMTGDGALNLNGTIDITVFGSTSSDLIDFSGLDADAQVDLSNGKVVFDVESANLENDTVYTFKWAEGTIAETIGDVGFSSSANDWIAIMGANGTVVVGSRNALPEPAGWILIVSGMIFYMIYVRIRSIRFSSNIFAGLPK